MSINQPEKKKSSYYYNLMDRLVSHDAVIAIVGMGYVGLPMAIEFAQVGFSVIAIENSRERFDALISGNSYVDAVDSSSIQAMLYNGKLKVYEGYEPLAQCDAVLICLPTPLDELGNPDLEGVVNAITCFKSCIRLGCLVILESTTYPGTTEDVVMPILTSPSRIVGDNFFLAYSPERIDPGNKQFTLNKITKIVGGITPCCCELATQLYSQIIQTVYTTSNTRVAETAKLFENTFRNVNIALVNELAIICQYLGIDVWEVIEAASTKEFGFMPYFPGPGLGGHCIPIDPHYLSWVSERAGYKPRLIEVASAINAEMPDYVIKLICTALGLAKSNLSESRILILGVSYKPNISDCRESPAFKIIRTLTDSGASVYYYDRYVPIISAYNLTLKSCSSLLNEIHESDCVVIITHHDDVDYEMVVREAKSVVDTRNITRPFAHLGHVYYL